MKELDRILELRRDIESIDERLESLKLMTQPKAQVISDMPRGGERKNSIEEYVIKSERLHNKREYKQRCIDKEWARLVVWFDEANLSREQKTMLRLRFYKGKPWKVCLWRLRDKYSGQKWSESKLFRLYRNAVDKLCKA